MDEFLVDVAFSFLGADEPLARRLNDILAGRLKTFIYSDAERQTRLAGADGGNEFARVFGREARTVAILYREGWGEKGFTAVEADAIRNRAYEFGYDFVTVIPLDSPPVAPLWLPRHRIWVGREPWGWDHVAAVIEARAIEAGGKPGEQTVAEVAAQAQRTLQASSERSKFLESAEGVNAASESAVQLIGALEASAAESLGLVSFRRTNTYSCEIQGGNRTTRFQFEREFINTLRNSRLLVWQTEGSHQRFVENQVWEMEYQFDRVDGALGWRATASSTAGLQSPKALAEEHVKRFLRTIVAEASKRR